MSENGNTTMNGTESSSCPSNPTVKKIGMTFAYCLIFTLSLAGNTVIGIIVYKTKTMRKSINFFIVNMAMSDLLLLIFSTPHLIQVHYSGGWLIGGHLGQTLCKLFSFLPRATFTVSVQSLVLIAVDRFGAVVHPLRSPFISSKLCPFFILATWVIAIVVFSPELFVKRVVEYPEKLVCERCWNEVFGESSSYEHYIIFCIVVFNFIPFLLIAILYITIYLTLKSQKVACEQSANAGQRRQQRERNVLKMAVAIVLGFAVCWLPIAIFWCIFIFTETVWSNCGVPYYVYVVMLALANCAINPCICLIFSRNYRNGVRDLFR